MDARDLVFLRGHVDPEASRFEVGFAPEVGISNGVLRGSRCKYIATVPCSESLFVEKGAVCKLELDLTVPELAGVDLRMQKLDDDELTLFWIDDDVRDAWHDIQPAQAELIDAGPPATPLGPGLAPPPHRARKLADTTAPPELEMRDGSAYLVVEIDAADEERMTRIVAFVTALAAAPERRAGELAAAFAGLETRGPERVRLDGDGIVAIAQGLEIEACYRREPAADCRARAIRAVVRSAVAATPLVVVDPELPKKRRPPDHGKLVERGAWLADGPISERLAAALEAARPSALVATPSDVLVSFAGPVVDPAGLAAGVALVAAIAGAPGAPYR